LEEEFGIPKEVVKEVIPTYKIVRMKVTACSPQDPIDLEYYRVHGYEGAKTRAVAANRKQLPKGTRLSIPGYHGGDKVVVDSGGGVIINRAARRGIIQIDVKFKTYKEAKAWGSRWLDVKVYN
jgi:3D (Asp-Asp-Asp) domain-containing protein